MQRVKGRDMSYIIAFFKGLWMYPDDEETPIISVIGSPNFGYRSAERDLEAQVTIFTRHPGLRNRLHEVDL
jgi:CDP-diacylglycerol--glycerol-3-phosphate 3-phosphatidyltransferase